MIHKIFTIFDTKAKAYYPPFFLPHEGMATRIFADQVADQDHQFGKHPEDYTLFQIGTFDDETAELRTQAPDLVATALQMVAQAEMPQLKQIQTGEIRT